MPLAYYPNKPVIIYRLWGEGRGGGSRGFWCVMIKFNWSPIRLLIFLWIPGPSSWSVNWQLEMIISCWQLIFCSLPPLDSIDDDWSPHRHSENHVTPPSSPVPAPPSPPPPSEMINNDWSMNLGRSCKNVYNFFQTNKNILRHWLFDFSVFSWSLWYMAAFASMVNLFNFFFY